MSALDRAARRAMWAVAGAGVAAALAAVRFLALLAENGDVDEAGRAGVAGLASLALFVSGIFWVTWFRLLFEPLEERGRTRFVGWRFWGWVIPGVDLVIPKMMVNDVWAGGSREERGSASWPIQVWWVLWVASRVVSHLTNGGPSRPEGRAELASGVLYFALLAIAAPFAVMAISQLTRRVRTEGEA